MIKKIQIILFSIVVPPILLYGQDVTERRANFDTAFLVIKKLVEEDQPKTFKKAVFITEYAFMGRQIDYKKFDDYIYHLTFLCQKFADVNPLTGYNYPDSLNLQTNYAVFKLMKDTIRTLTRGRLDVINYPYTYNFDDFFGHQDWTNMFVSKLLVTHKGNCHSLPYLYKILCDEQGATCWLAMAPNHLYIKNRCKKSGWYNTELTSGDFPIDAWVSSSGYIPIEAIRSGIYMDTLSNKQAIALCAIDLAKGYERLIKDYDDGFIIKCCDLTLLYHPQNAQALLLKAEVLKRIYTKCLQLNNKPDDELFGQMKAVYGKLVDLGYREMPEEMYVNWLNSVSKERSKYTNHKLLNDLKGAN